MDHEKTIAIILAIISFVIIFFIGVKTDILREEKAVNGIRKPYSFRKTQLWLWTLIIAPCFALNWGFVATNLPSLNLTALVLLGISGATTLTAEMISSMHKNNTLPNNAGQTDLKSINVPASTFWSDILKDDSGQLSVLRLQQLIFTITYIGIYLAMFFPTKVYPVFDDNAFVLMGISSGTYLIGKGLYK